MEETCYQCFWFCRTEGICAADAEELQARAPGEKCRRWKYVKSEPPVVFYAHCADVYGAVVGMRHNADGWPPALQKELDRKDHQVQEYADVRHHGAVGAHHRHRADEYRLAQWQDAMKAHECVKCGSVLAGERGEAAHVIPQTQRNLKYFGKWFIHHATNLRPVCCTACNAAVMVREYSTLWQAHIDEVLAAMELDPMVPAHTVTDPKTRKKWEVKK